MTTKSRHSIYGASECERALTLDRNLANARAVIGLGKYLLGRGAETEDHVNEALRLSPRDILCYRWMNFAGYAKLLLGDDTEAVAWLRRSIEANRNYSPAHFHLAAALALLGALDEARMATQAGLRSIQISTSAATASFHHQAITRRSSPDASASLGACALPEYPKGEVSALAHAHGHRSIR